MKNHLTPLIKASIRRPNKTNQMLVMTYEETLKHSLLAGMLINPIKNMKTPQEHPIKNMETPQKLRKNHHVI